MAAWEKVGNRLKGKWRRGRKISQQVTAAVWLGRDGNFGRWLWRYTETDRFKIQVDLESQDLIKDWAGREEDGGEVSGRNTWAGSPGMGESGEEHL